IAKVRIQRMPASIETVKFNSKVYWNTYYDTSFRVVDENYLISRDTTFHSVSDVTTAVNQDGKDGSLVSFSFKLPYNTVAWSYYIGVGQSAIEAYDIASLKQAKFSTSPSARIDGYSPLAALAIGEASYLTQINNNNTIKYYIVMNDNARLFRENQPFLSFKSGNVTSYYARMTDQYSGTYHFCLHNDSQLHRKNVSVKVTAVVVNDNWGVKSVEKMFVDERNVPYLKN